MKALPSQLLPGVLLLIGVWTAESGCAQERTSSCHMVITVPADAKVYINDYLTLAKGTERRFRSDGLLPDKVYTYRIRAEVQRDGKLLRETKTVDFRTGQTKELAFQFSGHRETHETLKPAAPILSEPDVVAEAWPDRVTEADLVRAANFDTKLTSVNTSSGSPVVAKFLAEGKLAEGEEELTTRLRQTPKDNELRFSLGAVQFLRAVEGLMQDFYHYGLRYDAAMTPFGPASIPFLRLPVPENPDPAPIRYEDARRIMATFVRSLWKAEATLAAMDETEVHLNLDFGTMRLDYNGDGVADADELLWKIFARVNARMRISNTQTAKLSIAFDRADAYWLRGYCHLLMAMAEVVLAHDGKELFERSAFLFFPKPVSPHTFLTCESKPSRDMQVFHMVDLVTVVHSINLPVTEPERMASALTHLEAVVAESRKTWAAILAETDNDREWIPSPSQSGAIRNVRVTQNIVQSWHQFLDELDGLLDGNKLVPFWRDGAPGQGINLRRVFTEPTRFDLVAWVQGSAATPYLEPGELTDRSVWQRLREAFGGQMMTFVVWFN